MNDFIFSAISFVVIYLLYVIFIISRKKKLAKFKNNAYVSYLVTRYGVNLEKTNIKTLAHAIALTNSFIISGTLFIISASSNLIIMLVLAIIVIIPFQLVMYWILGKLFTTE